MTVADALQLSRDAHDRYRDNLPRRVGNGSGSTVPVAGDAEVAGAALADACRFRAEAHVLDPEQVDPAWGDEAATHPHIDLLDFYVAQLSAEPLLVQAAAVDVDGAIQEARGALIPVSPTTVGPIVPLPPVTPTLSGPDVTV